MSKRAGTVVTLEDLVEAVGVDAARYALARSSSDSQHRHRPRPAGPAHQRQPRLLRAVRPRPHLQRRAATRPRTGVRTEDGFDPALLDARDRGGAARRRSATSRASSPQAAELREPHRVARYLEDARRRATTAGTTHCRVHPRGRRGAVTDLHRTRLWLNDATRQVLANGLGLLGVSRAGADVVRAHEAGALHAEGSGGPSLAAPAPATSTRWCRPLWAATVERGADGALRGGRRRRPRRSPREFGTPAYVVDEADFRARARAFRRRLRRGLRRPRRRRRRLLRRQGVPVHGGRPLGRARRACASTSAPAASSPSRCAAGVPGGADRRCTATTSPTPRSSAALDARRRPDRRRLASTRSSASRGVARRARRRRARAGAGHRRGRGAHPRVHRDRARGPEVRLLARPAVRPARRSGASWRTPDRLELRGLHSHIGSQIFDRRGFEVAARRVLGLHAAVAARARASSCPSSTSAAASASPTPPSTTRCRRRTWRPGMAEIVGRECRADGVGRARGSRSSPAGRSPARAPSRSTRSARSRTVALDGGAVAHLRRRRRRHERQRAPGALRRRLLRARWPAGSATRRRCSRGSSASTARAATSSSRTSSCPATSRPATCSPSPAPAPTAAACPASTTTSPRPPVVAVRDGAGAGHRAPRDRSTTCSPSTSAERTRPDGPRARARRGIRPDGGHRSRRWTPGRMRAVPGAGPGGASERERERQAAAAGRPAGLRRRRHRGGAAADRRTPTTSPRGSARRSSSSASPCGDAGATAPRPGVDAALFTTDAEDLVTRADVVVEVIGGIEPARTSSCARWSTAPRVVTANKALLAEDGPTLYEAADAARRRPLLRGRRRRRHPDPAPAARVARRRPTCAASSASSTAPPTTSSTRWTRPGAGFADALAQAQALGYAEADPTADVEGFDAAAKAAILASLAFHTRVTRRRRPPRGHHRGHRRRRRRGARAWAASSSCSPSASAPTRRAGRRRQRPGAPGDDPARPTRWPASARRSTPSSSRPRPPGS